VEGDPFKVGFDGDCNEKGQENVLRWKTFLPITPFFSPYHIITKK
jgi:hypothetical protein